MDSGTDRVTVAEIARQPAGKPQMRSCESFAREGSEFDIPELAQRNLADVMDLAQAPELAKPADQADAWLALEAAGRGDEAKAASGRARDTGSLSADMLGIIEQKLR